MENIFKLFDAPIIRSSKNRFVDVEFVDYNVVWLRIDEELVKVEKTAHGLTFSCSCKWCGKKGIANNLSNCGRTFKAIDFLLKRNGRISEIEIKRG